MTPEHKQLLEDYHAGRLNAEEANALETEVANNPTLQSESDFQSDIISGLKEFRKQELKSRLDAIPVSNGWIEAAQQSAIIKTLGGVVVASLIGSGIYFLGSETTEPISDDQDISINAPQYRSADFIWELGEESQENPSNDIKKSKPTDIFERATAQERLSDSEDDGAVEETRRVLKNKEDAFIPDFSVPATVDVTSEEDFVSENPGQLPDAPAAETDQPIDVKSTQAKGAIKYKYYDGKLFLTGDFENAPYEILEINRPEGRSIYVDYLDKFYKVGLSDKLIELPLVEDPVLIEELEILQQNK